MLFPRRRESSCLFLPLCLTPDPASESLAGMLEEKESLMADFTFRVKTSPGVRKGEVAGLDRQVRRRGQRHPGVPSAAQLLLALLVQALSYSFDHRHR